ncbi:hypothetical protein L1987_34908 [Smallanthus sonchifolius]|uniref:Uncharacterized protein n=1 Tax=Smallanthus sonchifolius TaxID=185202 RepID=A0ACB9HV57_9ASTR|nr:hypothetical protein L1987_34908 [Smallanthus sonchifolius]
MEKEKLEKQKQKLEAKEKADKEKSDEKNPGGGLFSVLCISNHLLLPLSQSHRPKNLATAGRFGGDSISSVKMIGIQDENVGGSVFGVSIPETTRNTKRT